MNDIAFVLCGGNSLPNEFPATVRWENYLKAAVAVGPNIQRPKLKRLLYHNPGGHYFLGWTPDPLNPHNPVPRQKAQAAGVDTREMWINQWLLAESAGLRFADREALLVGHKVLKYYGIEEIIYYVGSPDAIKSETVEDCMECVEMFLRCGKSASLAFDALGSTINPWYPGSYIDKFIDRIRKDGHKVYVEPRFSIEQLQIGLDKKVDGTLAVAEWDNVWKPDWSLQSGEVIVDPLLSLADAPNYKRPERATVAWRGAAGMNWQA
jgi:hypothetical protein